MSPYPTIYSHHNTFLRAATRGGSASGTYGSPLGTYGRLVGTYGSQVGTYGNST